MNDYWRKCCNLNHTIEMKEIDLNGINGIKRLNLKKGIFAICGLNGVGKSTIISAIKSIIGIDLDKKDSIRIYKPIDGVANVEGEGTVKISNEDGKRLSDIIKENNTYLYLEHEQAIEVINRITKEKNFEELLEQYDEYKIDDNELGEISYIIGKEYEEVYVREIDDDEFSFPFFRVKCNGIEYDSTKMGVGEHILFYYYIMINKIERNGLVVIEEPESCISVTSQIKFMNYMAKKHAKKQIQLIVTTHSPFIIKNIPASNIILLGRYGESTYIYSGEEKRLTRELGLDINKKGIIYVEDRIAKNLLKRILIDEKKGFLLEDYDIEYVNGEGEITSRLKSLCTEIDFNIIGIYDGDMRNRLQSKIKEQLKWKHLFLPGEEELENEFKKCVKKNVQLFLKKLSRDEREVLNALSTVQGNDYHDWFIDLSKILNLSNEELFNILYDLWIDDDENKSKVKTFIQELNEIV